MTDMKHRVVARVLDAAQSNDKGAKSAATKDALWDELNDLAGRIQRGKFGNPTDLKSGEANKKHALKEVVGLLQKAMKAVAPYDL